MQALLKTPENPLCRGSRPSGCQPLTEQGLVIGTRRV